MEVLGLVGVSFLLGTGALITWGILSTKWFLDNTYDTINSFLEMLFAFLESRDGDRL
ncbi:MAG TPA: hypothetical protein PLO37_20300 [Candidatus Hydrogenedentes bacterium]|nr:hypothetical protein [Candidatus Hydrogenedentota bacterium]HPG69196.1 hypothetical protein [Candidatus Hydrogenedentota bacterium]